MGASEHSSKGAQPLRMRVWELSSLGQSPFVWGSASSGSRGQSSLVIKKTTFTVETDGLIVKHRRKKKDFKIVHSIVIFKK